MRFHPGAGTKESIAKPDGTVSSTDVVVRFAFSVGTSRPNSWRCFESTTVGLISACAQATLVKTSAATVARAPVTRRRFMCIVPSGRAAASPPPRSGRERGRRPAGGSGSDQEHGRRAGGRARQCHDGGYDEARPADLALELVPDDRRMRRERVRERARGEDDERGDRKPVQSAAHRTRSVKGAVRIFPFAWNWRKSRQIPGSGTSTTTFRRPGLDERPTARAPPRIDVQPVAAG